jgi:hypothetical protein
MPKFTVDFNKLENKLLKRAYKLSDVQNRLETVAFDIVRFKDGDEASKLWQIQTADDGEYIVTLYDDGAAETTKTAAANTHWEVVFSKTAKTFNFYYKGTPITKMAADKLHIPDSELPLVEKYLPKKLSENKDLVQALLNELDRSAKNIVLNKYPELI